MGRNRTAEQQPLTKSLNQTSKELIVLLIQAGCRLLWREESTVNSAAVHWIKVQSTIDLFMGKDTFDHFGG